MTPITKISSNNNNGGDSILVAVASSSSSSMKLTNPKNGTNDHPEVIMGGGSPTFFVDTEDTADDDDVLMNEEEKMMMMGEDDDEEVTSVESAGDMEDRMMTMAVLNSLVDHHGDGNPTFEDDDIGDEEDGDDDDEVSPDDDLHPRVSGDPRPDAAPSSFAQETTTTSTVGRAGRKRVRGGSVDYSKKAAKNQLAVVPNPLSRPIRPPAALPTLKPGEAVGPDNTTSDGTARGGKITSGDDSKKKVNFSDQLESGGGRIRGFSIDLDLGIEFADVHSESADTVTTGSRKRAFSFECFAFGISADEPLPMLLDGSGGSVVDGVEGEILPGRMRSDSIAFDPSSFQDGGIFEQAALSHDIVKPTPPAPAPAPAPKSNSRKSRAAGSAGNSTRGADGGVTAFNANASVGIIPSMSTPFPMELLNKDGRIGIYLPDARKARIARFHAKRSKRVWRKRIKYDCRKKLADSRPRVKGRFVKRAD